MATESERKYFIHKMESIPFIHTHSITGAEFKTYRTPVVYVWKRGEDWLYVGCSYHGMQRIMDANHHKMNIYAIEDTDTILMMYNLTERQARSLESNLIKTHKPKYNKSQSMKPDIPKVKAMNYR